MELTIVGCAGSFPSAVSPASCYLLEAEGFRLALDLGSGALGVLAQALHVAGGDIYDVDAVVLSHLHPDHCLDLCGYYVARRYRPGGQPPRIPVWGPAGTAERLARAYDMPVEPGMTGVFDFATFTEGRTTQLGPFTLTAARVAHPVPAFALRVEHAGRVLVYSGDTGPCDALVDLARGADLLLCEATWSEGDGEEHPGGLHLTARQAGEAAHAAGVGRLLLTHLPAWGRPEAAVAQAREVFDGPVALARSLAVHEV